MGVTTRAGLERYLRLLEAIDSAERTMKEVDLMVSPRLYGSVEGGREEGKTVGGKTVISFHNTQELERFKSIWLRILQDRVVVARAELSEMGIVE